MNRSPDNILQEVLLVDDFSSMENLKEELEIYIKRFRGKVQNISNFKLKQIFPTIHSYSGSNHPEFKT